MRPVFVHMSDNVELNCFVLDYCKRSSFTSLLYIFTKNIAVKQIYFTIRRIIVPKKKIDCNFLSRNSSQELRQFKKSQSRRDNDQSFCHTGMTVKCLYHSFLKYNAFLYILVLLKSIRIVRCLFFIFSTHQFIVCYFLISCI